MAGDLIEASIRGRMKELVITGMTVSVEFGDKNYGNGTGSFMNLSAKAPDPGVPLQDLPDVMSQGLDMYYACWKTLLAGRYAQGVIPGEDFKKQLDVMDARINKIRKYLKAEGTNQ